MKDFPVYLHSICSLHLLAQLRNQNITAFIKFMPVFVFHVAIQELYMIMYKSCKIHTMDWQKLLALDGEHRIDPVLCQLDYPDNIIRFLRLSQKSGFYKFPLSVQDKTKINYNSLVI